MICSNCKREIPDGMRFCTHCGRPVSSAEGAEGESPTRTAELKTPVDSSLDSTSPTMRVIPADPRTPSERPQGESHGEKRLLVVTSVMATLAAVAAIALVVVILNPFGAGNAQDEAEPQEAPGQISVNVNLPPDENDDGAAEQDAPADDAPSREPVDTEGDDALDDALDDARYVLLDSATHLYTDDELAALSDWELYLARNEIYARHGRCFRNEDLQSYFGSQEWYEPLYAPEEFDARAGSLLNDTERANASTILSVEHERGSAYV